MDSVIGSIQSAFVKGRQIVDSFIIADEVIHSWKKDGKCGLLVKLDFEKAYDSVDHAFLLEVLDRMGFGARWQGWIKWCISSPSMSVLVNDCPTKEFPIEKGLCQGDPLSIFLFNLVVEVLSNDTILFLETKLDYLLNAKRILRCFELVSGLKINFHKSCLVRIGKKLNREEDWTEAFRCASTSLPVTYLGLPLGGNSRREAFWNPVISKVEHRLAPWKSAFISKGDRLVLIKAILTSLPSYFMSVFPIPGVVAKKLENL
ncbi:hypothetical protein Ddye_022780 [Dipteronia dyeriana]|uniref:Reverse transcriptase domain-containing protein n=1 Tax=Dipteronia dyeriana TaxID=168575 RepID=A0AAD9TRR2_9ROSI|nr:hypothetical protein Ddye_022780 [Dipteronia dyeriana]